MVFCTVTIAGRQIRAARATTGSERRQGMRRFSKPRPLLLSAAPIIHTWGCPPLMLVWVRKDRVCRVVRARSNRLYFGPAWTCLELPEDIEGIEKGDAVSVRPAS